MPSLLRPHLFFFFFNDTATTEIYTLSLHDALPISEVREEHLRVLVRAGRRDDVDIHAADLVHLVVDDLREDQLLAEPEGIVAPAVEARSEEHTSELQSPCNLVCRLLLEKKKKIVTS